MPAHMEMSVGSGHIGPGGQEICLDKKIDESSEYGWKLET